MLVNMMQEAASRAAQHEMSRFSDAEFFGKRTVYERRLTKRKADDGRPGVDSQDPDKPKPGFPQDSLVFSAEFEGGNLYKVTQVGKDEYDLLLAPDTGTSRHMQWFYFRIANVRQGSQYKFNIVNMCKKQSLYNCGLRPLTYSDQRLLQTGVGWVRSCYDIAYFRSSLYYRQQSGIPFRTLTFTYTGEFDGDSVFFAHCYPYGLQQLKTDLSEILSDPVRMPHLTQMNLCKTMGGNDCPLLLISGGGHEKSTKPAVVVAARCHPGETPASFMMRGVIRFLTSADPEAEALRAVYEFYVIPMLNPDGVAAGNSRSTLDGIDMNRMWNEAMMSQKRRDLSVLAAVKSLVAKIKKKTSVALVLDLHAHSRRFNVFAYGCRPVKGLALADSQPKGFERVFPKLLSQRSPAFSYTGCSYR